VCGILAHVALNDNTRVSSERLGELNELLHHRGPDDSGVFMDGQAALAMRRLSIIDIAGGRQPFSSADGRYVIVFNGEIYNHDELRRDLIQKGYAFKTRSDTEVLLYAFIDRGADCLPLLNGMFAFAVWDKKDRELFVARDRLGIKPLYYAQDGNRIFFSSELTPIRQSGWFDLKINIRSVSDYLAYWYICEPETIFENVRQLPPGHFARLRNGQLTITRYWEIPCDGERSISFAQASERLTALLEDSIKLRMKVDVPIGTFLSGGIDSGLITTIAAKYINERLKSFAIGFKEKTYSELQEAVTTAGQFGVELFTTQINEITPAMVDKIIGSFDEPLGNASYIPTYVLAQLASRHVKVVLTGDGGDELFGGYPTYQSLYYLNTLGRLPGPLLELARSAARLMPVSHSRISFDYRAKQLLKGIRCGYQRAHYIWREVAPLDMQRRLFRREILAPQATYDPFEVMQAAFDKAEGLSVKNQLMYADMNTYLLNDHLRKIDRMTMAHSLEARVPFLDHRIVEFAARLPDAYKVTFRQTKRILKFIARGYLPRQIIRGKKKGLTAPIAGWIFADLKDYIRDTLQGGIIEQLFDPAMISTLLEEHQKKQFDHSRVIWGLVTLQGWGRTVTPAEKRSGS